MGQKLPSHEDSSQRTCRLTCRLAHRWIVQQKSVDAKRATFGHEGLKEINLYENRRRPVLDVLQLFPKLLSARAFSTSVCPDTPTAEHGLQTSYRTSLTSMNTLILGSASVVRKAASLLYNSAGIRNVPLRCNANLGRSVVAHQEIKNTNSEW